MRKLTLMILAILTGLFLLPGGMASWEHSLQIKGSISTGNWTAPPVVDLNPLSNGGEESTVYSEPQEEEVEAEKENGTEEKEGEKEKEDKGTENGKDEQVEEEPESEYEEDLGNSENDEDGENQEENPSSSLDQTEEN